MTPVPFATSFFRRTVSRAFASRQDRNRKRKRELLMDSTFGVDETMPYYYTAFLVEGPALTLRISAVLPLVSLMTLWISLMLACPRPVPAFPFVDLCIPRLFLLFASDYLLCFPAIPTKIQDTVSTPITATDYDNGQWKSLPSASGRQGFTYTTGFRVSCFQAAFAHTAPSILRCLFNGGFLMVYD